MLEGIVGPLECSLPQKGLSLFQEVFPAHAVFMRPFFARALNASEVQVAKRLLRRVRDSFEGAIVSSEKDLSKIQPTEEKKRTLKGKNVEKKKIKLTSRTSQEKPLNKGGGPCNGFFKQRNHGQVWAHVWLRRPHKGFIE